MHIRSTMLDYVPHSRINDILYFNPADLNYPISFNLFEGVEPHYQHLVASGIMEVFKRIWEDISWGPKVRIYLEKLHFNFIRASSNHPFRCSETIS